MVKIMEVILVAWVLVSTHGIFTLAGAVNLAPDGLGEVLLFPYYTVRNGNMTLLSIINTRQRVKAVKLRFLEGKNGQPVLDFNLYLSPQDVWTGSLAQSATGTVLTTTDKSCTVPAIPPAGVEFSNTAYAMTSPDGEDTSLDRTREGYFAAFDMGVVTDSALAAAATHIDGLPQNCAALQQAWTTGVWALTPSMGMGFDPGGLWGSLQLVNVNQGTDYGASAIALGGFFSTAIHTAASAPLPNLSSANPETDILTQANPAGGVPSVVHSTWPQNSQGGVDAVSAVLMRRAVINEYTIDPALAARTDWVVNFPTKRFYVPIHNSTNGGIPIVATPPFTQSFWTGGAPEAVALSLRDREEQVNKGSAAMLPWAVNVMTFRDISVLGSALTLAIDTANMGNNGWMKLKFPVTPNPISSRQNIHELIDNEGSAYLGLPVMGFAVEAYGNKDAHYRELLPHKFSRDIAMSLDEVIAKTIPPKVAMPKTSASKLSMEKAACQTAIEMEIELQTARGSATVNGALAMIACQAAAAIIAASPQVPIGAAAIEAAVKAAAIAAITHQ